MVRSGLRLSTLQMEGVKQVLWSLGPSPSRSRHSHPSAHSSPSWGASRCHCYFYEVVLFVCLLHFNSKLWETSSVSYAGISKSLTGSSAGLREHLETHFSLPQMQTPLCSAARSQALSKENVVILPTKLKPENKTKSKTAVAVTKSHRLGSLERTEIYFSWF